MATANATPPAAPATSQNNPHIPPSSAVPATKPRPTLNVIRAIASIARILDKLSKPEQDQVLAALSELKGE